MSEDNSDNAVGAHRTVSRRDFLRLGAGGVAAFALASVGLSPSHPVQAQEQTPPSPEASTELPACDPRAYTEPQSTFRESTEAKAMETKSMLTMEEQMKRLNETIDKAIAFRDVFFQRFPSLKEKQVNPELALPQRVKGVALPVWWKEGFKTNEGKLTFERLAKLGVNVFAFNPTYYMDSKDATTIRNPNREDHTQSDEDLKFGVECARKLNKKVLLKVHTDPWNPNVPGQTEWRNYVGESYTEEKWQAFFKTEGWQTAMASGSDLSFGQLLMDRARFCQENGIECLVMATEMSRVFDRSQNWADLIRKIRDEVGYTGELSISLNHDQASKLPEFAGLLNFIGTSEYPNMPGVVNESTTEQISAAFQAQRVPLFSTTKDRLGVPVVNTEFGICSRANKVWQPWDNSSSDPVDMETQKKWYEAYKGMYNQIKGAIFWRQSLNPATWNANDGDYGFLGKPTEEVVASMEPRYNNENTSLDRNDASTTPRVYAPMVGGK